MCGMCRLSFEWYVLKVVGCAFCCCGYACVFSCYGTACACVCVCVWCFTQYGETALHRAVKQDRKEMFSQLMEHKDLNINAADEVRSCDLGACVSYFSRFCICHISASVCVYLYACKRVCVCVCLRL